MKCWLLTVSSIFTERQPNLPSVLKYPFQRTHPRVGSPWPMTPFIHRPATGSSIDFTLALYFPTLAELLAPAALPEPGFGSLMMIRWTVAKAANPGFDARDDRTGTGWQTSTHYSTLPNGWIPDDGVDFFKQFLEHLQARWLRLCQQGEELLAFSVRTVVL